MGALAGLVQDGTVYLAGDDGLWHWIPDLATFNALGFDWNAITWYGALPGSVGDPLPAQAPPAPPPPAAETPGVTPAVPATPPASTPTAPAEFSWGGRTWRAGDLSAFIGFLAGQGVTYATWANNHPAAAEILEGPPVDPSMQPMPKSLGEALAAHIQAGDTPAQAAAATEALRAALVIQGVSAVTPAELAADAAAVAQNYQSGQATEPAVNPPPVSDTAAPGSRSLQAVDVSARDQADLSNLPPIPAGFRAIFDGLVSEGLVVSAALIEHADIWIMLGTCKAESGFNVEHGKNSAGAVGPMQVVGYPAYDGSTPEVVWAWGNLIVGARMLARYGVIYDGDQQKISAAYNAGEGAVSSHWPTVLQYLEVAGHPEDGNVQDYVDKVAQYAGQYATRYGDGWNIDPTTGQLIGGPVAAAPAPTPRVQPRQPAGVVAQWRGIVAVFKTTVPKRHADVASANEAMIGVFK